MMTELRRRGRPRSTGTLLCDRCENLVPKIRVRWPVRCDLRGVLQPRRQHLRHLRTLLRQPDAAGPLPLRRADLPRKRRNRHTPPCDTCEREAERLRRGNVPPASSSKTSPPSSSPTTHRTSDFTGSSENLPPPAAPAAPLTWMRLPARNDSSPCSATAPSPSTTPPSMSYPPRPPSNTSARCSPPPHHPQPGDTHLARFTPGSRTGSTSSQTALTSTSPRTIRTWHHLRRLRADPHPKT